MTICNKLSIIVLLLSVGMSVTAAADISAEKISEQSNIWKDMNKSMSIKLTPEEMCPQPPYGGGYGYQNIIDSNKADYIVDTKMELIDAIKKAKHGDIIYLKDDAKIDMTGYGKTIFINTKNLTIASGRGRTKDPNKCALIYLTNQNDTGAIFNAFAENIRITGIRFQGPEPTMSNDGNFSQALTSPNNVEIDNCEIYYFGYAGISLGSGQNNPHIHHNYIHHCLRAGLGYGIVVNQASALIEYNKFDYCRSSVNGGGGINCNYETRYNLVLEHNPYQTTSFGMHGCDHDNDPNTPAVAGGWIKVHHNIFKKTLRAFGIHGTPYFDAEVHHNWFYQDSIYLAIWQQGGKGHFNVYLNVCGEDQTYDPNQVFKQTDYNPKYPKAQK